MSRTTEKLSIRGLVASAMEKLMESVAGFRGIYTLDLSTLPQDLRDEVIANLDVKAGNTGIFKTNIEGADLRIEIKKIVPDKYELQVLIGCATMRPSRQPLIAS